MRLFSIPGASAGFGKKMRRSIRLFSIPGASAGLGAACAEGFAAEGSYITITGRNKSGLEETAKKCQEIGLPSSKVWLSFLSFLNYIAGFSHDLR